MVLLNFLAALALLLWGTRQMQRALRDLSPSWIEALGRCAARGRYAAWTAGLVAGLLQAQEHPGRRGAQLAQLARLPAPGAHAATLGASVGCALTVIAFTIAPAWTLQVLLIVGAVAWNANRRQQVRAAGRALFGAGVVLLGLQILAIASVPAGDAAFLAAFSQGLEQEVLLACVFGVFTAVLVRSVFAAVLLLAAVGGSWLPPGATLALLAGIQVGCALAGYARSRADATEHRLAAGHLLAMLLAAGSLLVLLPDLSRLVAALDRADIAIANVAFCALAAAVLLNLTGPLDDVAAQVSADRIASAAGLPPLESIYQGESSLAVSAAVRQVMRLANLVSDMLHHASVAILENDRSAIETVHDAEEEIDDLYRLTMHYLAKIPHWRLPVQGQRRWEELIAFLVALEQVADGIHGILPRSEARKGEAEFAFAPAAQSEFRELHGLLSRNLHTAAGLCLERWPAAATSLLAAEETFRGRERCACAAHIRRVVTGDAASIAVSRFHLDLLADLANMNARVCGFARLFLELNGAGIPANSGPSESPSNARGPVRALGRSS